MCNGNLNGIGRGLPHPQSTHRHNGSSSNPAPRNCVCPWCFSSSSTLHPSHAVNASISGLLCDTTYTWLRCEARMISRAKAGSRSARKLVSGSLSTISDGGRGVSSAAISNR